MKTINALSLFANVGIAETYLSDININVAVANEIDHKRVQFYKALYPKTNIIEGDITQDNIKEQIYESSINANIDLIMATPPCQGMSTAGKQEQWDVRNTLICHAVQVIKRLKPKYVFLENVPEQLTTYIVYNGNTVLIPEYVKSELTSEYIFNDSFIINAADYGVPQNRERAIMLLVRKDIGKKWIFPPKETVVTLQEAIGNVPSLDPEIYDIPYKKMIEIFPDYELKKAEGLKLSKWHYPPKHVYRQVYSLMHTPTGQTAFDNPDKFKPKKKDGSFVKGFRNTYKRLVWEKPCSTITMFNRTIGSQDNVHPGRYIGKDEEGFDIYSDPRVLTLYEIFIVSSLPKDWNIPSGFSENFIRSVIGEGIPPLLVKKIMKKLVDINNE